MISVIIPVYNGEEVLRCCIDSLLLQTYRNIEIILVNDASTDKTLDVAKEYIKQLKDEGVPYKIIDHEENKGAPTARNHGFQGSKGEYVIFCDADSVLEKDCLFEMLQALNNNPSASYAYSSFYWGKNSSNSGRMMPKN
jgi:glycosyltransferase involved in cell wall biosynthesis